MKDEAIIDLITGQLTPQEKEEVLEWISDSPENREEYYRFKNIWALTSQNNTLSETGREQVQNFQKNIRSKKKLMVKNRILIFSKYAAIILIAFTTGFFVFKFINTHNASALSYNEISVPPGQMAQLTLSDGTMVFINACSKLKYPAVFKSGERRVFLSGEAFFSVTKNKKAPFFVEANNKVVKVWGTQFNIMAYPGDKYYQTTLIEGKISFVDKKGRDEFELKPGEQFVYDNIRKKQIVKKVKTNLFTSWKDGLYVFDHEPLKGLSERLERIFAVKITIKDPKIENYKFTGAISRNVQFEQILKIIQISAPIKYSLKETQGAIKEVTLYSPF